MKKLSLIAAALALALCLSAQANENTNTNNWTAKNLLYGPASILKSVVLAPALGVYASCLSVDVANDEWRSAIVLPYSVPAGFLCGSVFGAVLSPIYLLEGVFDTLTFGYFYPEHSDWLMKYAMHASDTVHWFPNDTPPEAEVVEEEQE